MQIPKLRAGHAWVNRPRRSLSFLVRESKIPVLFSRNARHFVLLSKYRPHMFLPKPPSLWDVISRSARLRFVAKGNTTQNLSVGPASALCSKNVVTDPHTPHAIRWPPEAFINRGWPTLHTARRLLVRRYPKLRIVNHEMYASLAEPKPPDVLKEDWRDHHRRVQELLLHKSAKREHHATSTTIAREVPLDKCLIQTRSTPTPLTRNLTFVTRMPNRKFRSKHETKYNLNEPTIVKDKLPDGWKERHKIKQEQLLSTRNQKAVSNFSCNTTVSVDDRESSAGLSIGCLVKSTDEVHKGREYLEKQTMCLDRKVPVVGGEYRPAKQWMHYHALAGKYLETASATSALRLDCEQLALKLHELQKAFHHSEKRTATKLNIQIAKCMKELKMDLSEFLLQIICNSTSPKLPDQKSIQPLDVVPKNNPKTYQPARRFCSAGTLRAIKKVASDYHILRTNGCRLQNVENPPRKPAISQFRSPNSRIRSLQTTNSGEKAVCKTGATPKKLPRCAVDTSGPEGKLTIKELGMPTKHYLPKDPCLSPTIPSLKNGEDGLTETDFQPRFTENPITQRSKAENAELISYLLQRATNKIRKYKDNTKTLCTYLKHSNHAMKVSAVRREKFPI
ncbi:uncharacterized protein LOC129595656 isoform X2 [Paramacrobiotus metropolitanus]|uniref:uncharacterized protein LOC129595656 isoform X2 n=1 Tax=Paramacrobiotus metropolitanus TaxID=2943436 RepID=UPI002445B9DD|nr:uncharacterized protein LOC129595656 isoform X2 [Paramacrobiotus metropolitanus]